MSLPIVISMVLALGVAIFATNDGKWKKLGKGKTDPKE